MAKIEIRDIPKGTPAYRRAYAQAYRELHKDRLLAQGRAYNERYRQTHPQTGKYSPEYYQAHKAAHQASQRKYRAKRREQLIQAGLLQLRVPLTPEERAQRQQQAKSTQLARQKEKYRHNINGFRDEQRERKRARYHSDPEFRRQAAAYLKEWRAKKRAEGGLKR